MQLWHASLLRTNLSNLNSKIWKPLSHDWLTVVSFVIKLSGPSLLSDVFHFDSGTEEDLCDSLGEKGGDGPSETHDKAPKSSPEVEDESDDIQGLETSTQTKDNNSKSVAREKSIDTQELEDEVQSESESSGEQDCENTSLVFKSIQSHAIGYCESTSVHGFAYLVDRRHWCEGVFWAFVIATGLTLASIIINDSLRLEKK